MANPILKITNNETDYYVVWDTYYELPDTIPMDLATLIIYLFEKKWTFTGLIATWGNLQKNNISLEGFVLNQFLKEKQFKFLIKQSEDAFIKSKEIAYRIHSNQISNKLEELSQIYQQRKSNFTVEKLELVLKELHEEFHLFINESLFYKISLLPLHLYKNINITYEKLNTEIDLDKLEDFYNFLFSIPSNEEDAQRAAKWFSKLLFNNNLFWYEIPYFVRKKFAISTGDLIFNNDLNLSFIRGYLNLKVVELELTPKNLLSYFNHQIQEHYPFAGEIKNYFQEIELMSLEENFINLNKLENYLYNNLLDSEILPLKIFNLSDSNGNLLLPSIYTDCFEDNGLLKFFKYNEQVIDIYSKNGDLIFTNLYDIDFLIKDNQLFAKYEGSNGYVYYKKIVTKPESPIQIYNVEPFDEWEEYNNEE